MNSLHEILPHDLLQMHDYYNMYITVEVYWYWVFDIQDWCMQKKSILIADPTLVLIIVNDKNF